MSGILLPPTFNPPQAPITVGSDGSVLTVVSGRPQFSSGGVPVSLGAYLAATVSSGTSNDFDPGSGWPSNYGRLDLDPSSGNATLTGLIAGADGQLVMLTNIDPSYTLTLAALNSGSSSANQFRCVGDLTLVPYDAVLACYYKGTVNKWVITP